MQGLLNLILSAVITAQAADPVALVKRAGQLATDGKHDEAIAAYEQALQRAPDSFDARLGIGIALDLKGDYAAARRHFAKAIGVAPESGKNQALTAMATSYVFEKNAKESSTFYRQVFDRQMAEPNLTAAAETANALGRVYLESGDLDNAFKWYQTAYETVRRQENLSGPDIDLWDMRWAHAQARIAARKGNAAEARKQTAAAKRLLDKGTQPEQMIQYPYLAGYVAYYLKDYAGAVTELQKASQDDPFILLLLAQTYEKVGDSGKAKEAYSKVLSTSAHSLNTAFARPLAMKKAGGRR